MRFTTSCVPLAMAIIALSTCSSKSEAGITVSTVAPSGNVVAGTTVTVTATVDGTYNVTGSVTNQPAGGGQGTPTTFTGTVTVTSGTGIVSVPGVQIPSGAVGSGGVIAVDVTTSNSGMTGAGSSTLKWTKAPY